MSPVMNFDAEDVSKSLTVIKNEISAVNEKWAQVDQITASTSEDANLRWLATITAMSSGILTDIKSLSEHVLSVEKNVKKYGEELEAYSITETDLQDI